MIICSLGDIMKKYTIELSDDLLEIYEDMAKDNNESVEETLQFVLKIAVDILLNEC